MKLLHQLLSIPALAALLVAALPARAATEPGKPQALTSPDQVPEGLAKSDWSSIRAAYEAGRHAFQPTASGWQARNPGQQWTTQFDKRGFLATPKDGGWQWGLELQSYGFAENPTAISGTPAVRADGQRLSYQWDANVEEWFVNDARGLEHGFTVNQRPASGSASTTLDFLLGVRGGLRPQVTGDALGVEFRDAAGATVLNYSGLKVWDADGKVLASRFTAAGENQVRLLVDERGARYPLTIDPVAQQAYLKASNNGGPSDDYFGISVAVSGDTVVVGANLEDSGTSGVNSTSDESAADAGAAYVFVRSSAGAWTQQAYLKASNTGASDQFGISVAVSGDTLVVGAKDESSNTTGVNSTPNESAGGSGAAYVFVRSSEGAWTQQAYLKASNTGAGDRFGSSVAVAGDTVVVGSIDEDSGTTGVNNTPNELVSSAGAAYVFVRSSAGAWTQQAYLKASQASFNDWFGASVAVSGDTVVVGAFLEDSSTTGVDSTPNELVTDAGAAYVFVRSGTTWSQQAYLKAGQVNLGDQFGTSVAVSGETVVVGCMSDDSSSVGVNSTPNELGGSSGAAYVFVRSVTTWTQQAYLKASNTGVGDTFGYSVAISGDTLVVGAVYEDSSTTGATSTPNELATEAGAAYVFVRSGGAWTQQAYLKASNTGASDRFGHSVAVSGETVVVGALYEDSSTTGVNSTPNELADASGAANLFVRSGANWAPQAYLKASNTPSAGSGAGDQFGYSVAVAGDTVVVGAMNEDSSTTGVNSTPNDALGVYGDAGAAYVFVRSGTTWTQQAYLKASNTGASDQFGWSVAVAGDTVVVGSRGESSSTTGVNSTPNESAGVSGAAYVFVRSSAGAWTQQAYLKAKQVNANDQFGQSVAVSGNTVVVGAYQEDSSTTGVDSTPNESASDAGAAYVFVRSSAGAWTQQAYLKAGQVSERDQFGWSVAVDGDTLVVGAQREDSSTGVNSTPNELATDAGAAYVFTRSEGTWTQQAYLKASQVTASDWFGNSVAVDGDTLVVGAYGEDSSTWGVNSTPNEWAASSGAAYVFLRSGTTWSEQAYLKAFNPGVNDGFGSSVAVAGDTLVVGAAGEDSSTAGMNSTPNDTLGINGNAGAAYAFVRSGTTWRQQAYLKASNAGAADEFGRSVAVSGDTVVVGANFEDSGTTGVNSTPGENAADSGAAYFFNVIANTAPQATAQSVTTTQDTPLAITLAATDADGNPLTYAVATGPANGSLSGSAPDLSYTPAANYHGNDSFTFTVNDGTEDSATATVSIVVNTEHQATAQAVTTAEDTAVAITLTGTNPNGTPLTYAVASDPANGSLSGSPPNLSYTPALNYSGTDSFTFTVSDGIATSATATISITLTPVNDAPLATAKSVTTPEDTAVAVTLAGTDPDGNPLTYVLTSNPANGSLSGSAPNLTYTPALNSSGSDSFTFTVSDGTLASATATVSITVTPVNDAPVATYQSVTTAEDTPVAITLAGTDVEGNPLTYEVYAASGSLTGTPPNLTYTPVANYSGTDSFTFKVNDGTLNSTMATVSITVTSVNDAPLATAQSVTTAEDTPVAITLAGTDAESSPLTYAVVTAPANGSLSGTAPNLTYTPALNYNGSDSFTYKVNDGSVDSATATVSITLTPVNDAALAVAQQAYLKASNSGANDQFGRYSVAVSGETVVVAAAEGSSTTGVNSTPNDLAIGAGAAYVFVRSGGVWTQQAYLKASHTGVNDGFGISVALAGDTLVVGAFREDSSTTVVNSTPNESATDSGAAYVFTRSGTTWTQQAYLKASNAGAEDWFGYSVAVAGDTVVVGAFPEDGSQTGVNKASNESATNAGAAYVFTRSGTTWSQQAYLKASNTGANDNFGRSVAVAGDTVVVGSHQEDGSQTGVNKASNELALGAGAAYVFTRSGTTWSQQAYLKASQVTAGDLFGISVAVSGETVVVGSIDEDSGTTGVNSTPNELATDAGAAYVFVRSGTTWSQQAFLKASQVTAGDYFGTSVAVAGDTLVVGAFGEDSSTTGVNSTPDELAGGAGAAYLFVRMGTTWTQHAYLKASNTGANDQFGSAVGVAGDTVVVGAYAEDSSTMGVNSTANESASNAGAAYAFSAIANNAPLATAQAVTTAENTPVAVTLAGTDADSDPLTYTVATGPAHGSLSGTAPNLTYTPAANYYGSDSFTFTVSDGTVDTSTAKVSLTVTHVNTAPLATAQAVTTAEDTAVAITLAGTDAEGSPLTYAVISGPANGSLSGTAPNLTYTPAASYYGSDSFTFTVNDGTVDSATATVSITVTEVKAVPVFSGYTASVKTGKTLAIAPAKILARASDPDGGAVTLTRVFGPSAQGGTVSLTGTVNYTPAASFTGTDSFDIELTGSQGGTLRATITVTVTGDAAAGSNQTELNLHDGVADLTFRGIPGRSYTIQRSTNLTTWTTIATVTAAADGKIRFTDTSPPQPSGYYRTQY